jgi:hypothetical protein
MEKPAFNRANLSNVRVIMTIMRVLVEEEPQTYSSTRAPVVKCMQMPVVTSYQA